MTHRQVLPPGGQTTNYNINKSTWGTELLMTVRLIYVVVNIYTICNILPTIGITISIIQRVTQITQVSSQLLNHCSL